MSTLTTRLGGLFRNLIPHRHDNVTEIGDAIATVHEHPRAASLEELRRGYGEALGMMRSVREHMDRQAGYNERVLAVLERLPEALAALPESQKTQARIADALLEQVRQQDRSARSMEGLIQSVARSAEQQGRSFDAMRKQFDSSREADTARNETMIAMGHTIQSVCRDSKESSRQIGKSIEAAQSEVASSIRRNTRSVAILAAVAMVCGFSAVAAVGIAVYAIFTLANGS